MGLEKPRVQREVLPVAARHPARAAWSCLVAVACVAGYQSFRSGVSMRARSGPTTVLLLLLPSLRLSFAAQPPVYDCTQLKCLALLVGNSKYRPGDADPKALTSPFHDVVDSNARTIEQQDRISSLTHGCWLRLAVAKLLQNSGATVTVKHDLTEDQMRAETNHFKRQLRAARKDSGGTKVDVALRVSPRRACTHRAMAFLVVHRVRLESSTTLGTELAPTGKHICCL